MWTLLKTCDGSILYQCVQEAQHIKFLVTDFKRIWYKVLSKHGFITLFIAENPSLKGADDETILNMVLEKMVQDDKDTTKTIDWQTVDNEAHLKCIFKRIGSITLKITLLLQIGSAEMFYDLVTLTLLMTINELKTAESELKLIIENKDTEIREYKNLGATLNIKYLITEKFDPVKYHTKYSQYDRNVKSFEHFLPKEIESGLDNIKKKREIEIEKLNRNNIEIKTENIEQPSAGSEGVEKSDQKYEVKHEDKIMIKREVSKNRKMQKRKISF